MRHTPSERGSTVAYVRTSQAQTLRNERRTFAATPCTPEGPTPEPPRALGGRLPLAASFTIIRALGVKHAAWPVGSLPQSRCRGKLRNNCAGIDAQSRLNEGAASIAGRRRNS